jgi:prepilin-type N-terminal cleavage/methylation domain-containing protein
VGPDGELRVSEPHRKVPHAHVPTSPRGFTLLELLVALTIAGSVALLAHRVFVGVAGGAARLEKTRESLDREMNARRLLTELVGSLDVGTPGAGGFRGERERLSFTAWAFAAEGWPRRRAVLLAVLDSAFGVVGLGDEAIPLLGPVARVEFDYLLEPGATEHWVREWISPVSAPVAIRVRVTRRECGAWDVGCVDTLLLIVGPRG